MKLNGKPRIELHYIETNLVIPCKKGQEKEILNLIEDIGEVYLDKDYVITVEKKKEKRSTNANAYYRQLLRQICEKKNLAFEQEHNKYLAVQGIPFRDKDGQVQYMLRKDNDDWLNFSEIHLAPTDHTETRNGVVYRWFYLLLPSRFFDTKQMSALIDTIVMDAKALGIETKTPNEIEELKQKWGCG